MRKIAIIYYSMSGNTEYVAKNISEKTGADLIRIVPKKEYPKSGFIKFLWGGKSAVMKETPSTAMAADGVSLFHKIQLLDYVT